jgi:hypothetical protein
MVFSYEGDLWKVGSQGGVAVRLTGMEGNEINPRISLMENGWLSRPIKMVTWMSM